MKLKQITKSLFVVFFVVVLGSCNENTTTYYTDTASANAQIYSFKLAATYANPVDSANFAVLGVTRFSIDQFRSLIYNSDSLPCGTRLTKYMATLTYDNPYKIQILYPNDSVADWATTDSIDFSLKPRIKVIPANGLETSARIYTVDIRIHKVDPDSLVWQDKTASMQLPAEISRQKTLMVGFKFYTFSINSDDKFYSYTIDVDATSPAAWEKKTPTGIPSSVKLESITHFNDEFYAVDGSGKSYASTDGVAWQAKSADIYNILGVLPGSEPFSDSLLVIVNQPSGKYFAKTLDMQNIHVVDSISNSVSAQVPSQFPSSGFSSATNYDEQKSSANILTVTGGTTFANALTNLTWSLREGKDCLEVISNQSHSMFNAAVGIPTFIYDGYLFALTNNLLYKTTSFGSKWIQGSAKEILRPEMPLASGQSVIVDGGDYIWIFGGIYTSGSPVREVWKGRINRLGF